MISKYVVSTIAIFVALTSPLSLAAEASKADKKFTWIASENVKGDVLRIAFGSKGEVYSAVSDRGVLRSEDGGKSWSDAHTGGDAGGVFWVATETNGTAYAAMVPGGVYRKTAADDKWKRFVTGLGGMSASSIVMTPTGERYVALPMEMQLAAGGVYKLDAGGKWNRISDPTNTYALAFDAGSKTLFGMNCTGWVQLPVRNLGRCGGDVMMLKSGEVKWLPVPKDNRIGLVMGIAADGAGTLYAGSNRGVFKLARDASTWISLTKGLPGSMVEALVADKHGNVYAGVWGHGMYWLPAGADAWVDMKLPQPAVFNVEIDKAGRIYVGTPGVVWVANP